MSCEWCGSDRHLSDKCSTRNLVRYLTGETVDPDVPLPEVVVCKEKDLVDTVKEVHAWMHVKGDMKEHRQ